MKNKLVILGLIFTFVLFLFLFFCWFVSRVNNKQTSVDLMFTDSAKHTLVIPLKIQDTTYHFLLDTGSAISLIDQNFADMLNLTSNPEAGFRELNTHREMYLDTFHVQKISCKLGRFRLSIPFFIDDKNLLPNFGNEIKGIIGQDVISEFNWLFDLQEQTVNLSLSKNQIMINKLSEKNSLKLSFVKPKKEGIPFVNLQLNDIDSTKYYFDTGYYFFVNYSTEDSLSYKIYPSLATTDSAVNDCFVEQYCNVKLNEPIKNLKQCTICDSIEIDNLLFQNISVVYKDSYRNENYITAHFIYQFEKMYYDSQNNEITLINYRGDTHPTGDEKELIQYINDNY